jgi:hypothetical protein
MDWAGKFATARVFRLSTDRGSDDEKLSQERQEDTAQDCRERQAAPLCQVPQTKPKTREKPGPLVLPRVPKKEMMPRIRKRPTDMHGSR